MRPTVFLIFALTNVIAANPADNHYKYPDPSCETFPPPPPPEPIEVIRLPLPPVAPSSDKGACTSAINEHGTGCTGQNSNLQGGTFMPDGKHVLASIKFAGAPDAPDPASIYTGQQMIIVKTDGTLFPNGDVWKCITCGVPADNAVGVNLTSATWEYPQAFEDGTRILGGTHVVDCGNFSLNDAACTANNTFIYPIRLSNTADGSGPGFALRELRIHPDNVHIGVNSFTTGSDGSFSEVAFFGRLSFDSAPTVGLPLAPRYDIVNASLLFDNTGGKWISTQGGSLHINHSAIDVGELRGFSGTGNEVTYIGPSVESCNIDVFAVDLYTGHVRRLTSHPGYCDPVHMSPDDEWIVIQDTRGTGRVEFLDGLRWLPPVVDLITTTICASERNNGARRFFQPFLLDRFGDRGDYYGQSINNASSGVPGSGAIDDPEWNGGADPWFSPDGTGIVYYQAQTVSPACGGANPLPCYNSTEPGGRRERLMLANLTSRIPLPPRGKVEPMPDSIPWAVPYTAGDELPQRTSPREGNYTLKGQESGFAQISIIENAAKTSIKTINIDFHDYSDDGQGTIVGFQNITVSTEGFTTSHLDWYTNLTRHGAEQSTQRSSAEGFHVSIDLLTNIFEANGTLTTVVDGVTYRQPLNET
nr:hypothetical protein CFP56_28807 [Quercus suber]